MVRLTIVVHPGHTGKGYGRRLMTYAINWANETAGVEKIELNVRPTNPRARKLYESLGFVVEGVHKERIRLSHQYVDDIAMALFVRGC
jgi:putative acetyltransferase